MSTDTERASRARYQARLSRSGRGRDVAERQIARGKLSARERIERLLDPGTFTRIRCDGPAPF
jgi:acetyl-CoA carboxylase carboxyltransferase component